MFLKRRKSNERPPAATTAPPDTTTAPEKATTAPDEAGSPAISE